MSFWDQVKAVFQRAETGSASAPTVHELIERTPEERAAYDRWVRTAGPRRLTDWLVNQYGRHRDGLRTDDTVGFLDLASTQGFVVYFRDMNYSAEEATYFLDYLRERILTLDYRPSISDRRIFPRRDWVETHERHYLKPNVDFTDQRMNQAFGNVTVELELRNDVPNNLRLKATRYRDALYTDGRSFAGLMEVLAAAVD